MQGLLEFLIQNGKIWVVNQREGNRNIAAPLSQVEKEILLCHFRTETLDSVRVRRVPQINNPDFYAILEQTAQQMLLDFRQMAGITFVDTILVAEPKVSPQEWIPLLFHECVHICQYRLLGAELFVERYVNGWVLAGFDYYNIPLEQQAYQLQSQFEAAPGVSLNVENLVESRWGYLVR
jgi:hypothetical protein